ncbi:MAG: hypothetical protein M1354_03565 [Candidatus Marsarchaeota archaeon]|nr:hypothetical protein [Candidatus Marsarchaeota archaeon]
MRTTSIAVLALAALSALAFTASAMDLAIQGPVNGTLHQGGSIYLGKLGPGESFYILASASTPNATGSYINIGWDTLQALNLPSGWSAQPSPLYENPMKLKITASPYAQNGIYNLTIRAVNVQNYSRLGNLTVHAYVNVTQNVFSLDVSPTSISTGVDQPSDLHITINNTGISGDPFLVNAYGLPAWNVSREAVSGPSSVSTLDYPVYVDEPGQYVFNLTVTSATSPLITQSRRITLDVQASVLNDYYATGHGVVLSPIIVEPAYGLMLLLSDAYNYLTRH